MPLVSLYFPGSGAHARPRRLIEGEDNNKHLPCFGTCTNGSKHAATENGPRVPLVAGGMCGGENIWAINNACLIGGWEEYKCRARTGAQRAEEMECEEGGLSLLDKACRRRLFSNEEGNSTQKAVVGARSRLEEGSPAPSPPRKAA